MEHVAYLLRLEQQTLDFVSESRGFPRPHYQLEGGRAPLQEGGHLRRPHTAGVETSLRGPAQGTS